MESLHTYLSEGVHNIAKKLTRLGIGNIKEGAFAAKFLWSCKVASSKREQFMESGQHIPPFLIASITKSCNLFCKGCYSRELNKDVSCRSELTSEEWNAIFSEAQKIGISFILLAGGEPLMRRDVIGAAAEHKDILFPIFTNGSMFDEGYLKLLDHNRNLLPVFSIEGERMQTDERRGENIYNTVLSEMDKLQRKQILFGASITVTTENIKLVTGKEYIQSLNDTGCAVVFFIEYVPVIENDNHLAFSDEERFQFDIALADLRSAFSDMILISFPGDEKALGGCLAAGRGFFHISASGDAEPCPFSPYSDLNLKDCTLLETLNSPLFQALKGSGILQEEHRGGCTLFARRSEVETLMLQQQ